MGEPDSRERETARKNLGIIRFASVAFVVAGAVCLVLGVLSLAGIVDLVNVRRDAYVTYSAVIVLIQAVFFLVLGYLGVRVVRDRVHIAAFGILSGILAVATAIEQLMSDFSLIGSAFGEGLVGAIYLFFCVLAMLSALVSASLAGYSKKHPKN